IDPPPIPQKQQVGSDVSADGDGVQRMAYLWPVTSPPSVRSPSWALAETYLKGEGISGQLDEKKENLQIRDKFFYVFNNWSGPYVRADDSGYQILVNWRKAKFKMVSIREVMEGSVSPEIFRDRLVVVGSYAPSLKDQFLSPLSRTIDGSPRRLHGIEIQAQVASQIISTVLDNRPSVAVWTEPWISGWILLWGLAGAVCVSYWGAENLWRILSVVVFSSLALFGLGFVTFLEGHWICVVPAVLAVSSTTITTLTINNYQKIRELNQRLEQQLDKQRAYRILAVLGNEIAQDTVNSFFYLKNSAINIRNLEEQFGDYLIANASDNNLREKYFKISAKLNEIVSQQEEEIERLKFNLAKSLPNLEGLIQNEILDLWESSLYLGELLKRLINSARTLIYRCYEIELRDIISVNLKFNSFKVSEPINLLVAIFIIIDGVI
ncbi:MAG: CHASE2 domain-containing protein, partial [Microcystaceae cyanobacterium]